MLDRINNVLRQIIKKQKAPHESSVDVSTVAIFTVIDLSYCLIEHSERAAPVPSIQSLVARWSRPEIHQWFVSNVGSSLKRQPTRYPLVSRDGFINFPSGRSSENCCRRQLNRRPRPCRVSKRLAPLCCQFTDTR